VNKTKLTPAADVFHQSLKVASAARRFPANQIVFCPPPLLTSRAQTFPHNARMLFLSRNNFAENK
jgi:hypothetical protein